jgi:8-oxo-dGTP pyrophosphatase MutT (NUDIX family)
MKKDKLFYLGLKMIIKNNKENVLILKSAKGYWEFPGGRIQDDEEPLFGLLREVEEETGLSNFSDIKADAMVLMPMNIMSYGVILWYHTAFLNDNDIPVTLSHEHVDYAWTSIHQAKMLAAPPEDIAPHIFGKVSSTTLFSAILNDK